ncbi:hypothetical protein HDU76_012624 [Blyttiomyces sp. JEL0837]|nr:hypothetical protein HDU76_012624 [Blyttiomyces sp. JEL0837]
MANLNSLSHLDIGANSFLSDLPSWIMEMTSLTFFSCWGSGYGGPFPDPGKLVNMVEIDFGNSGFTGTLPFSVGNLKKLRRWSSNRSNIQGQIPSSFGSLTQLQRFEVSFNQLIGQIPDSFNNLTSLTYLDVSSNCLSGSLPSNLANQFGLGTQNTNCVAPSSITSSATLAPLTSTSATPSSISASSPSSSSSSTPVGAIAGGVVGKGKSGNGAGVNEKDNLKKDAEAGRDLNGQYETDGGAIAAAIIKNSNEIHIPKVSYPAPSPLQTPQVQYVAVTTAGYASAPSPLQTIPAVQYVPVTSPYPTTSPNSTPPQFGGEAKSPNLFDANSSHPVLSTTSAYPIDSKQMHRGKSDDKKAAMAKGLNNGDGTNVEAVLQSQWGPYFTWSREQVDTWAKEKKFDYSVLVALRQHEVDGSMLIPLDGESLKSDLGITDLRTRGQVLTSIELLKLNAASAPSSNGGTTSNYAVAPPRGVSRYASAGADVAPPPYVTQ